VVIANNNHGSFGRNPLVPSQGELQRLVRLDLVAARRDGNRLYYRANELHPLFPDSTLIQTAVAGRMFDMVRLSYRRHSKMGLAPFATFECRSEVSPSNFIFAAKNVIGCHAVPPADKNEI
jgi:hypothetical protein